MKNQFEKHFDKILHFGACLIASLVSLELAIGLAIGKEYGDSRAAGNKWCWWDCLADGLGIACGVAIKWLILNYVV